MRIDERSELRRLFARLALFFGVNGVVLALLLVGSNAYVNRQEFRNDNTESNLLVMPEGEVFDLLFVGSSHGREMSRAGNHARVEAALGGRRVCNLSKGGGGGLVPAMVFADLFFARGNEATQIVYFIDPWILDSTAWNERNPFYLGEPFSLGLVWRMARVGVPPIAYLEYARDKLRRRWLQLAPNPRTVREAGLPRVDPDRVARRLDVLYPRPPKPAVRARYTAQLREWVEEATDRGIGAVFVVTPTLLGEEPSSSRLRTVLDELAQLPRVKAFDFRDAITDPALFYDHDHLNSAGVSKFTTEFLRPELE